MAFGGYKGNQPTSHSHPYPAPLLQVRTLCVSPNGTLMLSIDEDGKALLINRARRALLHHFSFKGPVAVARFSPDGKYIAVGVGRLVQVRGRGERGACLAAVPFFRGFRV